ncbi:hypothetical protein BJ508DRAFT_332830 [Ascobolus immersus RN42]|uniref:F-box domain-containing protein n=1 Tax=Ascobolus immersus RN42 TaxID=1160509 RepID=A0A3N4HYC2_ASCIM|nr:hypothetical protein BJ508DRAFT_332830 [Ascobolus immersus RN42]
MDLLPRELKLDILLLLDFPSLFNVCDALPSFRDVYDSYQPLVQEEALKRGNYHPLSVQLLDRFRPNEDGMGSVELAIFSYIHSPSERDDDGELLYEGFSNFPEFYTECNQLSTVNGVVGNLADLLMLERIMDYASWFYLQARINGLRQDDGCLDAFDMWNEEEDWIEWERENPAQYRMTLDAVFHMLLLTTYFHDVHLALRSAEDATDTMLQEIQQTYVRSGDGKEQRFGREKPKAPQMIYDYTFAESLTVAQCAAAISLAYPVFLMDCWLSSITSAWCVWGGQLEALEYLRVYLGARCGLRIEDNDLRGDDDVYRENLKRWIPTKGGLRHDLGTLAGMGIWRDSFQEMSDRLEARVAVGRVRPWAEDRAAFLTERNLLTTVRQKREGKGGVVWKKLEDFGRWPLSGANVRRAGPNGTSIRIPDNYLARDVHGYTQPLPRHEFRATPAYAVTAALLVGVPTQKRFCASCGGDFQPNQGQASRVVGCDRLGAGVCNAAKHEECHNRNRAVWVACTGGRQGQADVVGTWKQIAKAAAVEAKRVRDRATARQKRRANRAREERRIARSGP